MDTRLYLRRTLAHQTDTLFEKLGRRYQRFHAPFSERRLALIGGDFFLLSLILLGIWPAVDAFLYQNGLNIGHWQWHFLSLGIWMLFAWLNDLYDIPTSYDRTLAAIRIGGVGLLFTFAYLPVLVLFPRLLPPLYFFAFLILAMVLVFLWRLTYITLSALLPLRNRVLIVGAGKQARSITEALSQAYALNYQILGYLSYRQSKSSSADEELPVLGQTTSLLGLIKEMGVHEIIVATDNQLGMELYQILVECQAQGIRVRHMPSLYALLHRRIPVEHIDAAWAFHAIQDRAVFQRTQLAIKRVLDLFILLLMIPSLIVLLPILALAIRLDSPGPIFYRQLRCGQANLPFEILKFRTMVQDAEGDGKARWASKDDQRITRVGRFLRKARLDELPQILNVLRGEMSFIGPRPERPEFIQELQKEIPFYYTRLLVKPGLTGWAQVHYDYGNSKEDALRKLEYDFYYIRHWSIWLDLYVLFRTFSVVLKLKGL